MNTVKRIFLIVVGSLAVGLGIAGMFLPLLPTTPFLLLAAFCYARSSRRCYVWLMTNRWCGKFLRNYSQGRGIPRGQKVMVLTLLWITIGTTALLAVSQSWVRLVLLGIATGVTVHLWWIPTYTEQPTKANAPQPANQTAMAEVPSD